jgi:hypothetical protein
VCRYRFSVTSGTIFDNSKLPLWKWFVAIYLMVESKKGISASQIGRTIDVSYPTAWHLCHRIREGMDDDGDAKRPLLSGIVDVDETWFGNKGKGVGRDRNVNQIVVASAKGRDGTSRLEIVKSCSGATLHGFIRTNVALNAEAIKPRRGPVPQRCRRQHASTDRQSPRA